MKITPVGKTGIQTINSNSGQSAGADRIAAAKAALIGQPVQQTAQVQQPHPGATDLSIKRLKMNTQKTPPPRQYIQEPQETQAQITDPSTLNEPTAQGANEVSKHLDPEKAAALKARRALQVKESELKAREDALAGKETAPSKAVETRNAQFLADPLGEYLKLGGTYENLTAAVLKDMEGNTPTVRNLEAQVRELKEAATKRDETLTAKDQADRDLELDSMQDEAEQLIESDEAYQTIKETGSAHLVRKLIKKVLDTTGKTMSIENALNAIENDLIEQAVKTSQIAKVQAAANKQRQAGGQAQNSNTQMRTISNRDTVTQPLSRRERAIAAGEGRLK